MKPPAWRRYLRFWRPDPAADLDDELRFHLEARIRDYLAEGLSSDQARTEALRRLGNMERVREACKAIDRGGDARERRRDMWDDVKQDLRYAGRSLRRQPGFTLIAVLTLALGIGANTAIFSVVNGVLLRPLPYSEPDRLVRLFTAFRGSGNERYAMSQPEFMDYKGLTRVFENAAAFTGASLTLTGDGDPERVRGIAATADLFPVLGIHPALGRGFEPDDGRTGVEPVVVLTHEFWQTRFGGEPGVLNRILQLNGISRRVVGILPPGATVEQAQAFIPHYINPDSLAGRASNYLSGVARLRPGVSVERAQAELNALTRQLAERYANTYPAEMGYGATVVAMHDEVVGDVRPALLILLGAVGLVLLIACANVANLLLARGEARQREIAVRLALGGGRTRILRQLLTESSVLALAGAAGGMLLAWWGMKVLFAVNPTAIPRIELARIDWTVWLVTLVVALLTGLLFGLAPALHLVATESQASLHDGSRGSEGPGRHRLGRTLVAGEIALAVVVVIGAALLMRSFQSLRGTDPGFNPDGILTVDLALPAARYDVDASTRFYQQLVDRLGALPGVAMAAAASDLPPAAGGRNWDIIIDGRPRDPGQSAPSPHVRAVTAGYFEAMGIPAVRGRLSGTGDRRGTELVAVLNQTAARHYWPGEDPVGQRIRFDRDYPWITIVGVARDVRSMGLGNPPPAELYLVHEQLPESARGTERAMYALMRTAGDPAALAGQARAVVHELDPQLAIISIRTMDEMMNLAVAQPRFTLLLLGTFGAVALALAAIGIYGIMAYAVRRRTREIGIRMALGARPASVLSHLIGEGMRLALVGLAAGVLGALALTRLMRGLLYGVSPTDPLTFAAIVVLLAGTALLASWIPALRAVRISPVSALRSD